LAEVIFGGGDRCKSARGLDAPLSGREIVASKQRRGISILRRTAGLKRLRHRTEHYSYAGCLGRRKAERPGHLPYRQVEQPTDRGRGAKYAGRGGDMPPGVVVRGIDRIADARLRLEAEYEGCDEIAAVDGIRTCVREQRRCNGYGRM